MSATIGWVLRQLVLAVGPGLEGVREVGPGVAEARGLGHGQRGRVGRKALVEPEVVPPAHRHEVAEPHVRHLVQDRVGALQAGRVGDPGAEHVTLGERDRAGVLHRAEVELGHEELVVLLERVGVGEQLVEEVQPLLGHLEDLVGVEVLGQRAAAVQRQVDLAVAVGDPVVGPGDDRGEVGGDGLGRGEDPATRHARLRTAAGRSVGHDLPSGRGVDRQCERRLEVGLIEAGEHAVGVEGLELRVEEGLLVDGVDEAVQPDPGARVAPARPHHHLVDRRDLGEVHARPVPRLRAQLDAVEPDALDLLGLQVEEERLPGVGRGEAQRRRRQERGGDGVDGIRQVELDGDLQVADAGGPVAGLFAGQAGLHAERVAVRLRRSPSRGPRGGR